MQVSIPAIGNETSYELHPEIRIRTKDVALSAALNDRGHINEVFVYIRNRKQWDFSLTEYFCVYFRCLQMSLFDVNYIIFLGEETH